MKEKLTELKGEIDNSTNSCRCEYLTFNNGYLGGINKEIEDLISTINQVDLTVIFRT